ANYFHPFDISRAQFEIPILGGFDNQQFLRSLELADSLGEAFGLVIGELECGDNLQIAVAKLGGESRAQRAQLHLAGKVITVIARNRSVNRAAMTPQR